MSLDIPTSISGGGNLMQKVEPLKGFEGRMEMAPRDRMVGTDGGNLSHMLFWGLRRSGPEPSARVKF